MDKRIHTLTLLVTVFFLMALGMLLFAPLQQFMMGMLFGTAGLLLFFGLFGLWLLERRD